MSATTTLWASAKALAALLALYTLRVAILALRRHYFASRHGCKTCPRYPQRVPILGIDTLIETINGYRKGSYLALLVDRHQKYGRTFSFYQFGETTISTCDPALMHAVLSTHFKDFSNGALRARSFSPLLGRGILNVDGDEWHQQRAVIRPSFAKTQFTDLNVFEKHVERLFKLIGERSRGDGQNTGVDMQDLVQKMVIDANTEYLFGEAIGVQSGSPSALALNQALDYALEGVIYRLRLGKLMLTHRDPVFWQACRTVHNFADQYVARAREDVRRQRSNWNNATKDGAAGGKPVAAGSYILLNEMAKHTDDPILLRDEIVTIIMAARDTTSATISFALYLLARHPQVWARLRADVLDHFVSPLTFDALDRMAYLRFIITEVLRLFPPIANNGRMAVRDVVLPVGGGDDGMSPLLVTKGTTVLFSAYVMQRRVESWGADANEFRPERWDPNDQSTGLKMDQQHSRDYLPFLGGPRTVSGSQPPPQQYS